MSVIGALRESSRNGSLSIGRESTFRARLTVGMTVLCAGVLALAGAVIYTGTRELLLYSLDSSLLSIARNEISSIITDPKGSLLLEEDLPFRLDLPVGPGYEKLAQVQNSEGEIICQTSNLRGKSPLPSVPPISARRNPGGFACADLHRQDQRFRAIYYPLQDPIGNRLTAVVALPRTPVDSSLMLLGGTLLLSMLLGGGAAAFGANRLARELTRPLAAVVQSARSVRDGNLSSRVPEISRDVELQGVTFVLNEMLDRLEESFAAQEQLIASQRRFIGDASHELRSPVSNLRGAIEVTLRRPRGAAEYREALQSAHGETVRMCRLVEDLLTLSRADAGQFHLEFGPCDLSYIVRQAAIARAVAASEAEVRLFVDASGAKMACADRDRIRQVVDNLLENALRYAPRGSAVQLTTWEKPGAVGVSVQDSGPGVSPEERARIFDRFYRTDQARSRHSGGMGLGLAIAGAIVDAHKGSIRVSSQPGNGATFVVSLPPLSADSCNDDEEIYRAHGTDPV